MRKFTIVVILLLAVLGVILFPQAIYLPLTKWRVQAFFSKGFGQSLSYESLVWEGGSVVLRGGHLAKNKSQLDLDEISFTPHFRLKDRCFLGEVKMSGLTLTQGAKPLITDQFVECFSFPKLPFISHHVKATIEKGALIISEGQGHKCLAFSLACESNPEKMEGSIELKIENQAPKIVATFSRFDKNRLKISSVFAHHPLSFLVKAFNATFSPLIPSPHGEWDVLGGVLSGYLNLTLEEGRATTVEGDLRIDNLLIENGALALRSACSKLETQLCIDLTTSRSGNGWNGAFDIKDANVCFQGEHRKIWQESWDLTHLNAKVFVHQGELKQIFCGASLLGMQGEVVLNWLTPDDLLHLSFLGSSKEVVPFLPEKIKQGWKRAFPDDPLALSAKVVYENEKLQLQGELCVNDSEKLFFGCDLGELREVEKGFPSSHEGIINHVSASFIKNLEEQLALLPSRKGWFKGEKFPLAKYFSPFLFHGTRIEALGWVDFEGEFEGSELRWTYSGQNCCLKSPHFFICAKTLGMGEEKPSHTINLKTLEHSGFCPLPEVDYVQKNLDLSFAGAGALFIEGNHICLKQIQTRFEDLALCGQLDLRVRKVDDIDLQIRIAEALGPITSAQRLLSHFTPSVFWELPLEGQIRSVQEKPIEFQLHFAPKLSWVGGVVPGTFVIESGKIPSSTPFLELRDARCGFEYDHRKKQILFTNALGTLHARGDEYTLAIPTAKLFDFPVKQLQIQGSLIKGDKELLKLVAMTQQVGQDPTDRELIINAEQSHFGAVEVGLEECYFKQWTHLQSLKGHLQGESEILLAVGHELARLGLMAQMPSSQLPKISGSIKTFFSYLPSRLDFSLEAPMLSVWQQERGPLHMRGEFDFNHLTLKDLSFADATGSAEFCLTSSGWHIENFCIKKEVGEKCLLFSLNDHDKLMIASFEDDIPPILIHIGTCALGAGQAAFDGFDFSIAPTSFSSVLSVLERSLSIKINPELRSILLGLRGEQNILGRISFERKEENIFLHMAFEDGIYHFLGKELNVRNLSFVYDPIQMNLWTEVEYNDVFYWVHATCFSSDTNRIEMALSESNETLDSLLMVWKREPQRGWFAEKVVGSLCGLEVALADEPKGDVQRRLRLVGTVAFDGSRAISWLPSPLSQPLSKVKMGRGYTLEGRFSLSKQDFPSLFFLGKLVGRDCEFMGVELAHLTSDVRYAPQYLELKNVEIKDRAVSAAVDEFYLVKNPDGWQIKLPHLRIHRLRPALLVKDLASSEWRRNKNFTSLYLQSCELLHFCGHLGDPCSFSGNGSIQFTNFPKKGLISNILLIPSDIIARIGLDLTLLVPVRGMIDYQLEEGKIALTQFYEMFSNKKRSRFLLAKEPPSYIDFEGNLDLNIKMKQYNLLMKIVELFQVNVQGTVKKPKYIFTPLWHVAAH